MGIPYLCGVRSGWTGSISVTYAGVTATVEPSEYDSAPAIFSRLILALRVLTGNLTIAVEMVSPPIFRVSAASDFEMTVTGNVATRLGLTDGFYSGASSYEGPDNASNTAYGWAISLDGSAIKSERADVSGDGAALGPRRWIAGTVGLKILTQHASVWALEAAFAATTIRVWDLGIDGRFVARLRLDQPMERRPMTRILQTGLWCELSTQAQGVRL